jgi:hypothetical protein
LNEGNLANGTGDFLIRNLDTFALALEGGVSFFNPDPRVRKTAEGPRVVLDFLDRDPLDGILGQQASK